MRRPSLDCEFVIAELNLAIQLIGVGDMPDALDAIEIARDHIRDWLKSPDDIAVEGRTN